MSGALSKGALAGVLVGLLTGSALAGPVSDFETSLRQAYAPYRVALFATNTGAADKALTALEKFRAQWAAVSKAAPAAPQYSDDPALSATLSAVETEAETAQDLVQAGDLAEAHETLEGIRDEISALHQRNGIIGFSDRMNAYHAVMEEVLAVTDKDLDAQGLAHLAEQAGVLAYLAAEIEAHPAPEAQAAEYGPLHAAFQASVAGFVEAVRSGTPDAVMKAIGTLKAPYSKFFVAFG